MKDTIQYKRLVAYGCSWTFGEYLPDCNDPDDNRRRSGNPSKLGWPNILANKLSIDNVVNKGFCGASNKLIWKKILDTNLFKDDLVVIFWSYIERTTFFSNVKNINVQPASKGKLAKIYYRYLYDDQDSIIDANLRIHHIDTILKQKNIDVYHVNINPYSYINLEWNTAKILDINLLDIRNKHPRALDNQHPGIKAHQEFAERVYNEHIYLS